MYKALGALLGLAIIGAVFAGIHYAPQHTQLREEGWPRFNIAPGEVRSEGIQPAAEGAPIHVSVTVLEGSIDVYVMDREWARSLPGGGTLHTDAPFSYHSRWSQTHVTDVHEFTFVSDGRTSLHVILDNADTFYANDAVPDAENGTARVDVVLRYLAEEDQSLTLGYIAAVPSGLLVVWTVWRQVVRHRQTKADEAAATEQD